MPTLQAESYSYPSFSLLFFFPSASLMGESWRALLPRLPRPRLGRRRGSPTPSHEARRGRSARRPRASRRARLRRATFGHLAGRSDRERTAPGGGPPPASVGGG
eukprot:867433-Prorocentrum_minimum.AAC.2